MIFRAFIILSNRILSYRYLKSKPLGCKIIEIRQSEFVAKTQFLWGILDYLKVFRVQPLLSWKKKLNVFQI